MGKIFHAIVWLFKKIISFIIRDDDNNFDPPPENGDGNIADILVDYELEPEKINPFPKKFKLSSKSKRVGKLSFKQPHPNIEHLQIKAARTILSLVGGHYLPRRLKSLLKYYDAFFAVNGFLAEMMGFSYRILLTDHAERQLLEKSLDILLQADLILKDSQLDDVPIYQAIKSRKFKLADSYINILYKVSPAIQELQNSTIKFQGDFLYRKQEAEKLLRKWHTLDEATINKISKWHSYWSDLQQNYDLWATEVDSRIIWIQNYFSQDLLEKFDTVILPEINECKNAAIAGTKELIEESISKLKNYVELLESLIQDFKTKQAGFNNQQEDEKTDQKAEEKQYEEWEWIEGASIDEKFVRAYCIFEFNIPHPQYIPIESELRKTYLKLVKKYHPDYNSGNKVAEEKFKSLGNANNFLRKMFKY